MIYGEQNVHFTMIYSVSFRQTKGRVLGTRKRKPPGVFFIQSATFMDSSMQMRKDINGVGDYALIAHQSFKTIAQAVWYP